MVRINRSRVGSQCGFSLGLGRVGSSGSWVTWSGSHLGFHKLGLKLGHNFGFGFRSKMGYSWAHSLGLSWLKNLGLVRSLVLGV